MSGVSTVTMANLGTLTMGTYVLLDYDGTPLSNLSNFLLATTNLAGFGLSLMNNSANTSVDLVIGSGTVTAGWNVDNSGNWSLGSNWAGNVEPNDIDDLALFGSIITSARTVTVDAPKTVGTITFDNANAYTISGSNTITLSVSSGNAAINVLSGTHQVDAPISLSSNLVVASAASTGVAILGDVAATGRSVTKTGTGTVTFKNVRAASLSVNQGLATIRAGGVANDPAGTSVVSTLSIDSAGPAQLDLTNNSMVIDYTGAVGTLVDDMRLHLENDRLTSSAATLTTRLGYGDNAVLGKTDFAGQAVDATSVLIKFTYFGDTDLDGDVDVADLGALATNWQTGGVVWTRRLRLQRHGGRQRPGTARHQLAGRCGQPAGAGSFSDALASLRTAERRDPRAGEFRPCAALFLSCAGHAGDGDRATPCSWSWPEPDSAIWGSAQFRPRRLWHRDGFSFTFSTSESFPVLPRCMWRLYESTLYFRIETFWGCTMKCHLAALASAMLLVGARIAWSGVTLQLIDRGVPTNGGVSAVGYSAFTLRLMSDSGRISAVDFSTGVNGIYGPLVQQWYADGEDGIYNLSTPGFALAQNITPGPMNFDSHFLHPGQTLTIIGPVENGTIGSPGTQFGSFPPNSLLSGFGQGSRLFTSYGMLYGSQATTLDLAYVVIPNSGTLLVHGLIAIPGVPGPGIEVNGAGLGGPEQTVGHQHIARKLAHVGSTGGVSPRRRCAIHRRGSFWWRSGSDRHRRGITGAHQHQQQRELRVQRRADRQQQQLSQRWRG